MNKEAVKMNKEAVERTDKAVLLLIGIWADEKILQQLDICSQKTDLREDIYNSFTNNIPSAIL